MERKAFIQLVTDAGYMGLIGPGPEKWNYAREEKEYAVMVSLPVPQTVSEFLSEFENQLNSMTEGRGREAVETLLIDIFFKGLQAAAEEYGQKR